MGAGLVEAIERGHVDLVEGWDVAGSVASDHDAGGDRGEVRLGVGQAVGHRSGGFGGEVALGAVGVLGGEHGEHSGQQPATVARGSVVGVVVAVVRSISFHSTMWVP